LEERVEELGPAARPLGVQIPVRTDRSARREYRILYRFVALTDVASIAAAMLVAYWIRFGIGVPADDFLYLLLGTPFVILAIHASFHLYEAYRYTPAEEFRRLVLAIVLGIASLMLLSFWFQSNLSRMWVGLSLGLSLVLGLLSRRSWHRWMGRQRQRGRLAFDTLVVGNNREGRHLVDQMARRPIGFRPVGIVAVGDDPDDASVIDLTAARSVPVVGRADELRALIERTGAECVFVASSAIASEDMRPIAEAVRLSGVEVRITATLPEVLASRLSVQPLGGITALSLRPVRLTGTQMVAKLTFDILLAGLLLIVLAPLLAAIALAIRTTSPGPVLFRQQRVGLRGRPFTMLKFRTMGLGADAMVDDLRAARGVDDVMFKLADDPRVTRVGRFLRRYSLDELPQLLNVVRGEMSLVGPRPPLPEEVTRYEPWQFDRLEVPPGITGLWQVSGRADLSFDDCVRLDVFYIENWSLAYDLYILGRTIPILLSSRGAY
jgi:exopolysaccharide biosynthesis polyprenyl glycosylphosphotransferase